MPHSLFGSIALVVHVLVIVAALALGGRAERLGGLVLACASALTILIQDRGYQAVDLGLLAIDILQFTALLMIARLTSRRWAVLASAMTLLAVIVHLAMMIQQDGVDVFPYLTLYALIGYLIIVSLGVGTATNVLKRRSDRPGDSRRSV